MRIGTKKKTHTVEITRGEDVGIFQVDPMDVSETSKLLQKYTTHEKVKGIIYPDTDYFNFALAKVKRVIVGWNLEDEDGKPLDCNDENKKVAYVLNPKLINDVLEEADKLAEGMTEVKQAIEKN